MEATDTSAINIDEEYRSMFEKMSDEKKQQVLMDYYFLTSAMLDRHFEKVKWLDVSPDVYSRVRNLHGYGEPTS